ncbi:pyruvate dehydrogenase E3 component [Spiroplasma litorale]|uniref:Dihydrolipoyl dehydrogenase n=1 Tax=Spiroplasma litorale TaxID=216942 RepID=A0A0K1W1W1_9MOLU|nr:dihydrolipoyl dehydrogenase [Spiroplasma litorale]AKX34092.1 pyruvate dehydrogenase E3 component [Spiroplasma litorale]
MFKVKFADIGEGLTEGTVTEIHVKKGDNVKSGDPLFNVETDKVNSDIFAPTDGKISKILISQGQEIKVGDVVIEIDDGKDLKDTKSEPIEENASVVGSTPVSNDLLKRGRKIQISKNISENEVVNKVNSILDGHTPNVFINNTENDLRPAPKYSPKIIENHFDVIMVGAGVGGYVGAIKCSRLGLKTLIIEKQNYGGVCLNIGCIPTKTLLKSADLYEQIIKSEKYGIKVDLKAVKADWKAIQERKIDVVSKLTNGVKGLLKKNNVNIVEGEAKALDKNTIEVNKKIYTCDNLIIATGSVPNSMNLPGAKEAIESGFLVDSTGALALPKIPKKLVIIGGGVIGVEFACVYKRLGAKVTILQFLPTILEMLDSDVSKEMTKELMNRGNLEIITGASTKEFKGNSVIYEKDGKTFTIEADYCLQSVGRKTVTTGFDNIGLNKNERNHIIINDHCETNIDGVYAIGDVTGKMMLAHVASYQGLIAANRIAKRLGNKDAEDIIMNYNKVPSCIYTHPEVAMIGKTEDQLKKEGIEYKAYKFPFAAIGKALADGNTTGFVKLICEPKYKEVIGAHIIANTATDMISEITTLMEAEGTITELSKAIHPHPTLSEAVWEAAEALEFGKPINF